MTPPRSALFAALGVWLLSVAMVTPGARASMAVVYTDILNVFTVNQRINAALGINVAPGATGSVTASANYFERSRAAALGEWTSVPYAAGNFSVPAACVGPGCSWTVAAGNQTTYKYMLVGKTMWMIVRIDGTTIVGAPTSLRVAVPGGFTINSTVDSLYLAQVNAVFTTAAFEAGATSTSIWFYPNVGFGAWAASASNNSLLFSAFFEVQ